MNYILNTYAQNNASIFKGFFNNITSWGLHPGQSGRYIHVLFIGEIFDSALRRLIRCRNRSRFSCRVNKRMPVQFAKPFSPHSLLQGDTMQDFKFIEGDKLTVIATAFANAISPGLNLEELFLLSSLLSEISSSITTIAAQRAVIKAMEDKAAAFELEMKIDKALREIDALRSELKEEKSSS
jgi:hypothetical protein